MVLTKAASLAMGFAGLARKPLELYIANVVLWEVESPELAVVGGDGLFDGGRVVDWFEVWGRGLFVVVKRNVLCWQEPVKW